MDPAQSGVEILHLEPEKSNPAQSGVEILHFRRERADSAQSQPGF